MHSRKRSAKRKHPPITTDLGVSKGIGMPLNKPKPHTPHLHSLDEHVSELIKGALLRQVKLVKAEMERERYVGAGKYQGELYPRGPPCGVNETGQNQTLFEPDIGGMGVGITTKHSLSSPEEDPAPSNLGMVQP